MPIYLVETVVVFRERYAIKAKSEEHALDTVACEEAEPFDSEFLAENIVSARKVKKKRLIELTDQTWLDPETFIHEVDYDNDDDREQSFQITFGDDSDSDDSESVP